jgi:RNA polymerase sigma factor (sigma-70 family)
MAHGTLAPLLRYLRGVAGADGPLTDGQLIARYADHDDEAAFAALVRRHARLVLAACRQVLSDDADIEDAFQATFLVLVRRAKLVRWRASIGSWLFGVAHRVAVRARADARRRRRHEGAAREPSPTAADPPDLSWREACAMLHDELDRLPDKFRLPLLLCYLDGKSRDEAARELGWTAGSVKGRLERGRAVLRDRLLRRGVTLTAGLFAALGDSSRAGTVPARLVDTTLSLGTGTPAAAGAAGVLADGVLRTMGLLKLKLACAVALLGVLGIGLGARGPWASANDPAPRRPAAERPADPAKGGDDDGNVLVYGGRVLDPDGKPFAGAKVYLTYFVFGGSRYVERATSGPDGGFRFTVARGDFETSGSAEPWTHAYVVATAAGFGPVSASPRSPNQPTDLTLRLAPDLPVKGRVVDLEGRPVPGVHVVVDQISYLQGEGGRHIPFDAPKDQVRMGGDIINTNSIVPDAVTDRDGRFEITGLGRDRRIDVVIEGPTIERRSAVIVTRMQPTRQVPGSGSVDRQRGRPTRMQYGAEFTHVIGPCKPIAGVVRDKATGQPVAGIHVLKPHDRSDEAFAFATTDKHGRYRLVGLPRAESHELHFDPGPGRPYFQTTARVAANAPGVEPVVFDIALKRTPVVRGRLTEVATDRPVAAVVEYRPLADNPHLRTRPEWAASNGMQTRAQVRADRDSRYVVPALPGRGVVFVSKERGYRPVRVEPATLYKSILDPTDPVLLNCKPQPVSLGQSSAYGVVDLGADAKEGVCNLTLDAGRTVEVYALAPDGAPLRDVQWHGQYPAASGRVDGPASLEQGIDTVKELADGEGRRLFLWTADRRLAGHRTLQGTETGRVPVVLRLTATLTGRVVDEEAKPLEGVVVQILYEDADGRACVLVPPGVRIQTGAEGKRDQPVYGQFSVRPAGGQYSDADGRFRLAGLFAELPCVVRALVTRPDDRPGATTRILVGTKVIARQTFRPGVTTDLGTVRIDWGAAAAPAPPSK